MSLKLNLETRAQKLAPTAFLYHACYSITLSKSPNLSIQLLAKPTCQTVGPVHAEAGTAGEGAMGAGARRTCGGTFVVGKVRGVVKDSADEGR
jgi:hypothetical protein